MKRVMCLLMLLLFPVVGFGEAVNDDVQMVKKVNFTCNETLGVGATDIKLSINLNKGTKAALLKVGWLGWYNENDKPVDETANINVKYMAEKKYRLATIARANARGIMREFLIELSFRLKAPSVEPLGINSIEPPYDVKVRWIDDLDEVEYSYACNRDNEDNESSGSITVE